MACLRVAIDGDVQRCHGDGYYAVRGAECVVLGAHASRDHSAGDGVTRDSRQVGCSERREKPIRSHSTSDDAASHHIRTQG